MCDMWAQAYGVAEGGVTLNGSNVHAASRGDISLGVSADRQARKCKHNKNLLHGKSVFSVL